MDWLSNAGSVLGFVALLVAAVAVAYSALNRTTITTLQTSNAAYEQRISQLENESRRDKATILTVTSERDTLAKVVTGEAHLVAIEQQLSEHHTEATGWWSTLSEQLDRIGDALEAPA